VSTLETLSFGEKRRKSEETLENNKRKYHLVTLVVVTMNVFYIDKKPIVGLSGKWKLPLGKYFVDVYVWVNKDGLLSGVGHQDEAFDAAYVHFPSRKIVGGLFGEIHIMEDTIKPGIVAHELEHALLDWTAATFDFVETNSVIEKVCEAMEGMTKVFWDEYYDVFVATPIPEVPEMPAIPPEELTVDPVSDVENSFLTVGDKAILEKSTAGEEEMISLDPPAPAKPAKKRRAPVKAKSKPQTRKVKK
jgi:hypothetical protein